MDAEDGDDDEDDDDLDDYSDDDDMSWKVCNNIIFLFSFDFLSVSRIK